MIEWWYWQTDGWIVAAAVLCAMSCALLGNFMVLRRMSMMGDAISHSVLPGLAAAFLLTGSRDSITMLVGAVVVGILTAVLTQGIARLGKVEESASMGVVFTALFALGLVLIRQAADKVDIDPSCVLYGVLESVWIDVVHIGPIVIPRTVLVLGVMFLINTAFVLAFYKELKISSFDPELATTLGINANVMHYLLMTLVATTTVASFEAVGSILVVAMLIVPPATAHLLTDRLGVMIFLSLIIAALAGVVGHISAVTVPGWFGYASTVTSGMMAAVAGGMFLLVMLFAPRQGIISKLVHRSALSLRILAEDVLGLLYRVEERGGSNLPAAQLRHMLGVSRGGLGLALLWLRRQQQIVSMAAGYGLTQTGRDYARGILRSHRLWESYLVREARVAADHSHSSATRLEHITDRTMQEKLTEHVGDEQDPQGKPIPRRGD